MFAFLTDLLGACEFADDRYTSGFVVRLETDAFVIRESDPRSGLPAEARYRVTQRTRYQNCHALSEILPGERIALDYREEAGERVALTVIRKQSADASRSQYQAVGRLISFRAGKLSLQQIDFDARSTHQTDFAVTAETKLFRFTRMADLRPGADLSVHFVGARDCRLALSVSLLLDC